MKTGIRFFFLLLIAGCVQQNSGGTSISAPLTEIPRGTDVGNGGDHVRSMFFKTGEAVIKFLETTDEGKAIAVNAALNLEKLKSTLSIQKVSTVEGVLKDNGGSDVDAIGKPDSITLKKEAWLDHFEKERDIYYLVLHEMLRSGSYQDDNYVISKAINPFPRSFMVSTRITPLLPLIQEDLLAPFIDSASVAFNGTGCSKGAPSTYVDFDTESNVVELNLKNYSAIAASGTSLSEGRKNCSIAIPVAATAGKRVVISLVDVGGIVNLPVGANAKAHVETFTADTAGPVYDKVVEAVDKPINGRILVRINETVATPCGKAYNLRLATSALVKNSDQTQASLKLDRIRLSLKLESCQ